MNKVAPGLSVIFKKAALPKIARKILRQIRPGDVLALKGELAAGKTALTQALLKMMGSPAKVTSPTFVLEKHYPVKYHGINEVVHLDFYRVGAGELKSFGWPEYLGRPRTLTIIEWPSRAKKFLPVNLKQVSLEIIDEQTRRLTFQENFGR